MGFENTITPYKLNLDFKQNKIETINIHQYDKDGRTILVTCTDNGIKTSIDYLSITARVKWMKPDNLPVFNDCIVNEDGTITITITEQMSITNGIVNAELMLSESASGSILHTMQFKVVVIKGVFSNDTVTSSYEFDALNDALVQTDSFIAALNGHKSTAASETILGHVKLTNDSVTTTGVYALDAVEKNDSVSGTMANNISILQSNTPIIDTSGSLLSIADCVNGTMHLTDWTKNLLTEMTITNLKTANTSGTWTNDSSTVNTYAWNGITWKIDSINDTVKRIVANGTATADSYVVVARDLTLPSGKKTLSGCPSGGSITTYRISMNSPYYNDFGTGITFADTTATSIVTSIVSGYSATNLTFLPQIEFGSTKHNYVSPSGYSVTACGKNIFNIDTWAGMTAQNGTVSINADNSITLTATDPDAYTNSYSTDKFLINGIAAGTKVTISFTTSQAVTGRFFVFWVNNSTLSTILNENVTHTTAGIQSYTFTAPSDCRLGFRFGVTTSGESNTFSNIQVEIGKSNTSYEGYNGNTITITNDTVSPAVMLGYSGMTNVFSRYGGNVKFLYPKTQIGKSLLESYDSSISGSLANQLSEHKTTLSSDTVAGHSKLSRSTSITTTGVYALDAVEKNASVAGTLSNEISTSISNVKNVISDAYSASSTYAPGALVIYNTTLYKCTTAITTAEVWNSVHWTATTVDNEVVTNICTSGISTSGNLSSNSSALKMKGDVVNLKISIITSVAMTANTWYNAMQLPLIAAPLNVMYGLAFIGGTIVNISIDTAGLVTIRCAASLSIDSTISGNITYIR